MLWNENKVLKVFIPPPPFFFFQFDEENKWIEHVSAVPQFGSLLSSVNNKEGGDHTCSCLAQVNFT